MKVTLSYPPSVNRAWRNSKGKMYQPAEITQYKRTAGLLAKAAGAKIIEGAVQVEAILHPKTKKDGNASKVLIDLDNLLKVVLDGFNGVCYRDDKQVQKISLEVGKPILNGGVTVIIEELKNA